MNLRVFSLALLAGLCVAGAVPPVAQAADDKCVEQCDEDSDACMSDAGDDEKKQKSCEDTYEECIKKCG